MNTLSLLLIMMLLLTKFSLKVQKKALCLKNCLILLLLTIHGFPMGAHEETVASLGNCIIICEQRWAEVKRRISESEVISNRPDVIAKIEDLRHQVASDYKYRAYKISQLDTDGYCLERPRLCVEVGQWARLQFEGDPLLLRYTTTAVRLDTVRALDPVYTYEAAKQQNASGAPQILEQQRISFAETRTSQIIRLPGGYPHGRYPEPWKPIQIGKPLPIPEPKPWHPKFFMR